MRKEMADMKNLFIDREQDVDDAVRMAARQALLMHKREGRAIATWRDGKVVVIPAAQIHVEDASKKKLK